MKEITKEVVERLKEIEQLLGDLSSSSDNDEPETFLEKKRFLAGAVAFLLLLAVALLCTYELCAVYVMAGSSASDQYSPSGFFFGVSAIALAINMLFICRMVFDVPCYTCNYSVMEMAWTWMSMSGGHKFAYADSIEMGPVSCLPEPPDPNELYPREFSSNFYLHCVPQLPAHITAYIYVEDITCVEIGLPSDIMDIHIWHWLHILDFFTLAPLLFFLSTLILYGLTAKDAHWLGAITSAAVIILDWSTGACLYGFQLLKSRVAALFVAGTSRFFLIFFGVHYWYLGHCISYAVVASVLLGAAVSRHFSATNPLAARRDALQSTVIRLREGFRRKEQNSSSSSSDGCGSSVKRSSSIEAGYLTNIIEDSSRSMVQCSVDSNNWNNLVMCPTASFQEGISSDKSIDSGRPSSALHSSSHCSVVQEHEVGTLEKIFDPNSSLLVCSSSVHDSQGCESSTSTSANQQMLDLSLALAFQERLSDPRITSMLKRRARHGDRELTSLLQDKGLDPNFAMMLKEKSLDPTILALLQRSSLDADRDHRDNTDITIVDSNSVDNAMPNQISLSEELRLEGFEKWLKLSRIVLHHIASTRERAWVLFSFVFIIETIIVAVFRSKTIKIINSTHQQFEFGFAVLLLSPVVCSIMAFICSLQGEETPMTPKPRRYGFVAWLLSTCVGLLLSFLSKSSVLLGLSLTIPLMVACLSVAIPIWIRNGYQFWVLQVQCIGLAGNHRIRGTKEVCSAPSFYSLPTTSSNAPP
ncbi:hypothetical protein REPUB_Repub05bG0089300 [Reevesia pubescens]